MTRPSSPPLPKSWFDAELRVARQDIASGAVAEARARLQALRDLAATGADAGAMGEATVAGLPRRLHAALIHLAAAEGDRVTKVGLQATQVPDPALMLPFAHLTPKEKAQAVQMAGAEVPRALHQIWIGPKPVPDSIALWQAHARTAGYTHRLWREADLARLGLGEKTVFQAMLERGDYPGAVDIARYAVLASEGGVYLDADWYPVAEVGRGFDNYVPLTGLMVMSERTVRLTGRGAVMLANNLIGAPKGHPAMTAVLRAADRAMQALPHAPAWWVTGPLIFTDVVRECPLTLLPDGIAAADITPETADPQAACAAARQAGALMLTWKRW